MGTDGATYKSIEFEGSAIDDLDVYGRLTLTNMAVEAGAKTGIIASDGRTLQYLKEFDRGDKWKELKADEGAIYESEVTINANGPRTADRTPEFTGQRQTDFGG